jgi:hypothetical protein
MSGGIFRVRGNDELVEIRESRYEADDVLQALIAKFPSPLAGAHDASPGACSHEEPEE